MTQAGPAPSGVNAQRANEKDLPEAKPRPKLATINAALVIGTETDAFNSALKREVEVLTGFMYGARNPRNTQDGKWKSLKLPLLDLIQGFDKTDDRPEFGLSRHPLAKQKAGPCIVLGSSIDGARQAKAMKTMSFLGLDIDSGADIDDVLDTLESKRLFCLVHTSYNHGKRGLELKRDEVLRKLGIKGDPTEEQVKTYLREHDKNQYEESFIEGVSIAEAKCQVKSGVVIALDTPPLHKFRLIFPLAEPVKIIDQGETHQEALDDWENAVTGMAHSVLGIHFDTSCTDPSRLFYTPRHPASAGDEWGSYIVMGDPLDFASIPRMTKSHYTSNRAGNAFAQAAGDDWCSRPDVILDSGFNLTEWHSKVGKNRFMLADLLEDHCADKIRVAGGERAGHVHTECPFEHEHTSEGGTGTMAINCIDSENEYWTWFCKHDACQGRHKTEFLGEAIHRGWFEEELLLSEDYLLPLSDEEIAAQEVLEKVSTAAGAEELAAQLSRGSTTEEIRAVVKTAIDAGADMMALDRLKEQILKATKLGRREFNSMCGVMIRLVGAKVHNSDLAQEKEERKSRAMDALGEGRKIDIATDSSDTMNRNAILGLKELNRKEPRLFHFIDDLAVIRHDSEDRAQIEPLTRQGALSNIIHDLKLFVKNVGQGDSTKFVQAYPLKDTVSYVWELPKNIIGLPLRGVKTTPFFGVDGSLVFENGYDPASKLFLAMPMDAMLDSAVRRDWVPSQEEVDAAVLALADVFADFPLDAMSRKELDAAIDAGDDTPSFATLIGLLVAGMAREMIDGPTPAHFMAKPTPGTGASLLTEVATIILTGEAAPTQTLPENDEELSKTISSILFQGRDVAFFDNINHSIDSGEFASILTKRVHGARVLGKSKIVDVEVRILFILNGNSVTMSGELLRRSVPVFLDTKLAKPTEGRTFKYPNIKRHVEEKRWALVTAVLTLIQNWVAKGCPDPKVNPLASYEEWTRVVGGVLEAAEISGFMSLMDEWADTASDAGDDSLTRLMALLAEHPVGTVYRPSGTETPTDADTGGVEKGVVVSVTDLLNDAGDPDTEGDPILLKGWSYKELFDDVSRKTRVIYSNAAQISKRLRASARVPYTIGAGDDVETLHLEERRAKKNGARYWVRVDSDAKSAG